MFDLDSMGPCGLSARRALPTVGPLPPTLSVRGALNQYNPKFDPAIVPWANRGKDRNQLRCAAIRSLTCDGNSTSGRWPQPASMTRRACGNAAASSSAFIAAGVTRSSSP
jgi:hypothetical protein